MTLLTTAKHELGRKSLAVITLVALLYIVASVYAINRIIIFSTATGDFPLDYKISLLSSILTGSWQMYSPTEAFLTVLIALLLGINIALVVKLMTSLRGKNGVRMSFGGSSLFALVSTGCPSCGVSILSLVGISSPLLPLQGVALQVISVMLLAGSIA